MRWVWAVVSSCVVVSFGSTSSVVFWRLSYGRLSLVWLSCVELCSGLAVVMSSVKLRYVQFG